MSADRRRSIRFCCASALVPVLMMASMLVSIACGRAATTSASVPILGSAAGRRPGDCAACHPVIVDEWQSSGHARAWTDSLVQEEYRAAPAEVCVRCHAPNIPPGVNAEGTAAEDGIDCAICHQRVHDGDSEREFERGPEGRSGHSAGSCGACHQFRFFTALDLDPRQIPYAAGWLQDTVGEWARSDAGRAGISCQQCHMPEIGGHRSHRFPGMYDRELVANAVLVEVRAQRHGGQIVIDATISAGEIGHSFPTGDLFREAIFRVWTEEAESDCAEFKLKRWFADRMQEHADGQLLTTRVEIDDTRVPPPGAGPPRQIELRLRSPAARRIAWSLDLYPRDAMMMRSESGAPGQGFAQHSPVQSRREGSCTPSVRAAAGLAKGDELGARGGIQAHVSSRGLRVLGPTTVTPVASGSVRIVAASSHRMASPGPAGHI